MSTVFQEPRGKRRRGNIDKCLRTQTYNRRQGDERGHRLITGDREMREDNESLADCRSETHRSEEKEGCRDKA